MVKKYLKQRSQEASQFLKEFENTVPEPLQRKILSCSATEMLKAFEEGVFTAEQALITLALRSIRVGIPKNYVADTDFYNALKDARQKDLERKTAKGPLGRLHGLPICIKDHTTCKNFKITCGLSWTLSRPKPTADCTFVAILRSQGAIPFISSNIPQMLGAIETYNNVFGRAENPWNPSRTVGGSSGGEAGLIATRCSVIGIGSDAAGSIRIPSAFTGIYGFLPTARRMTGQKTENIRRIDFHYYREVGVAYGPMGRNVDDLALICKTLFGEFLGEFLDLNVVPKAWTEEEFNVSKVRKLRIGYNFDSDHCEPCPAVRNALMETIDKLKARGHTLIEVKHDFTNKFYFLGLGIMSPYGIGTNVRKLLKGEKPGFYYALQLFLLCFPRFIQKFFIFFCNLIGQRLFGKLLDSMRALKVNEFYDKVLLKEWMKDDFVDMWESYQLDGMLSPVLPFPAIKHYYSEAVSSFVGGTLIYNMLGSPAGSVPIRRVRKDEQHYNIKSKDLPYLAVKKNIEGSEGLPVAVQVAAMSFQDEKCLAIMKEIEECFNYHELTDI